MPQSPSNTDFPCEPTSCAAEGGACVEGVCAYPCSSESTCDWAFCGGTCSEVSCSPQGWCGADSNIGDPAYTVAVPYQQYRQDYIVLTPLGYSSNYINVITPHGIAPYLDGAVITGEPYNAVPTTLLDEVDIYRIPVDEGVHYLQSNSAFGAIA